MFSICKSESTKSSCRLLDLEPLKHSITERTIIIIIKIIIISTLFYTPKNKSAGFKKNSWYISICAVIKCFKIEKNNNSTKKVEGLIFTIKRVLKKNKMN